MENTTQVNLKTFNTKKSKNVEKFFEDKEERLSNSRNLLSLILEFSNIKELSIQRNINKKCRDVIDKKFPILIDFFNERKKSEGKIIEEEINFKSLRDYLRDFHQQLRKKYSSSQIDNFSTEIFKNLIPRLQDEDHIYYSMSSFWISDKENCKYFSLALKENKTIKNLDLTYYLNKLYSENFKMLFEAIGENSTIQRLCLSRNFYGVKTETETETIQLLCNAIEKNTSITELLLYSNQLGNKNFKLFLNAVTNSSSIIHLDVSNCFLGSNPENMKELSDALLKSKKIFELGLSGNSLGSNEENMKNLCGSIAESKSITSLDLSNNSLGTNMKNMLELSKALKANSTLKELDLERNELGRNFLNVLHLSDGIKGSSSISCLKLYGNALGKNKKNIPKICEAIKALSSLEELDFGNNLLGLNSNYLKYFSESLAEHKTITRLYLDFNSISKFPENLETLFTGIIALLNLKVLNLQGNKFGPSKSIGCLFKALRDNKTIQELNLSENLLGRNSNTIKLLSDLILGNSTITKLYLEENFLFDLNDNMWYLSRALIENSSLKDLDISDNFLGEDPDNIIILTDALRENNTLEKINLYECGIKKDYKNYLSQHRRNLKVIIN